MPAVADRYCAMRGELFEPGGCSACPTSPAAAATIRAPTLLPEPAPTGAVAAVALVPIALWRAEAKVDLDDEEVAGADCGGAKALSSACTRVRTDSRLTTG